MEQQPYPALDNPVWFSLSETHQKHSIGYEHVKFYHPDYCPFGGFTNQDTSNPCAAYSQLCNPFFIVGEQPMLPDFLRIEKELICLQMVVSTKVEIATTEEILPLTTTHSDALFQLVNQVQPGYFRNKTFLLGDYFGIFKNGKLIAAAGERMKMNRFTEVSAIVTHPDHTGKGYAGQLTAHVVNKIFDEGKLPFLHVVNTNQRAIALYEKLGFITRRNISFWLIRH